MSAAFQLPVLWAGASAGESSLVHTSAQQSRIRHERENEEKRHRENEEAALEGLCFYRRHTEKLLRRYLYASMQVGRTPAVLGQPIARGAVSSRPVRSFEDAVIFVLDIEKCLNKLEEADRKMIRRIILQEYTHAEAAELLDMSVRAIGYKLPRALDRLTRRLLDAKLLILNE